jgi:hypothetical protein
MTTPDSLSATRQLDFRDPRPPRQLQHLLERELMVLLPATVGEAPLTCRGVVSVNGALCQVVLRFVAALPRTNAYFLELTMTWADLPPEHHDYCRRTSAAWFDLWTRAFTAAPPVSASEGSAARYAELAAPVTAAAADPDGMEAVQREILAALRAGASFSTAHKEGGTHISWKTGAFVRQDHGESDARETFGEEADFLRFLRRFYDWETSRNHPPGKPPSESDRWQLILRLLQR